MRPRSDFLLNIVDHYRSEGHPWPASTKDIARWALDKGLWAPKPEAVVNQCAEQLSRAMAAEYFTDPQGRRVRAKHAVVLSEGPSQYVLWDDIRTAEPRHIEMAFQQRRRHILDQCQQLKNDVDYYNDNRQPDAPLQMVFDFTLDLEERALALLTEAA